MQTHPDFLLIAGLVIVLGLMAVALLIGGACYARFRCDEEIGVADTQGRERE